MRSGGGRGSSRKKLDSVFALTCALACTVVAGTLLCAAGMRTLLAADQLAHPKMEHALARDPSVAALPKNALHLLWPTLIHVHNLEGFEEANEEMAAVISTAYDKFRRKYKAKATLELDELESLNNAFYSHWSNHWGRFRSNIDRCEASAKRKQLLAKCKQMAFQKHPLMRLAGHAKLRQAALRNIKAFLVTLGLPHEADKVEEDQIFWWGTVHKEGMHHGQHDHPGSLVSGTYYCTVPGDGGHLRLFDTRDTTNGNRTVTIAAKGARMVLFPGWQSHQVLPTKGLRERVGMAFNLERSDKTAWIPTSHSLKDVHLLQRLAGRLAGAPV